MKKQEGFWSYGPIFGLFAVLYVLHVAVFWPGVLRPDSVRQLHQASLCFFSDHHPPLMAVVWMCFNYLYPTPGMMLMAHLFLLYSAAFIFSLIFKDSLWRYFYVISALFPPILFYSAFILKDIGFTFSFLCCASLLALYSVRQKRLSWKLVGLISVLLFYGTAVKFQAIFILPVMTYWMASCASQHPTFMRKIIQGGLLFTIIAGGVHLFNTAMTDKKDYAWQFVKIYDLVSIGLQEEQDLLPDFVKSPAFFSEAQVKSKFNSERVDSLVFDEDAPLCKGKTEREREIVWDTWAKAVLEFPRAYLVHRGTLFYNLINKPLIKSFASMQSAPELIPSKAMDLLLFVESLGVIKVLVSLSPFKFYLPFMIVYYFLGLYCRKRTPYAVPLMFLNGAGLLLLAVLFIFSMASDGRYTYLALCFFHFSHPFFFKTLWQLWEARE